MRRLVVWVGLGIFMLTACSPVSAQEEEKTEAEPSAQLPVIRSPLRPLRAAYTTAGPGSFPRIFEDSRPAPPDAALAAYPVKSEKLFGGWLGRVEDVLRTKRLFRIEAEEFGFKVDVSYERQYFHGNPQHPSYASPVPASSWRMGIRLKL
ncbi:hypothetical protein C4587_01125 [Candidatus Parcubacteria bacterium]|nr:MAG: hypothetical protein C4587_01125 [Candidatus Parcubacteria bacterium]